MSIKTHPWYRKFQKYLKSLTTRKLFLYATIGLLTLGASLTLGFLSFGGMYVLTPIIAFPLIAFGFSVAYEAEVYFQNIKNAFKKLFSFNYLQNHLAGQFLKDNLDNIMKDKDRPSFFNDYDNQLKLAQSGNKIHTKKLKSMERWFSLHLFAKKPAISSSKYIKNLLDWLENQNNKEVKEIRQELINRMWKFRGVMVLSTISSVLMGLGTLYMAVEVLGSFGLVALTFATPAAFIPLGILVGVAGIAYGLMIYNTITNMINNNTLVNWYNEIKDSINDSNDGETKVKIVLTIILAIVALIVFVCSGLTAWSVAQDNASFFASLFNQTVNTATFVIMQIIYPIIFAFDSLSFDLENSKQTYNIIIDMLKTKPGQSWGDKLSTAWNSYWKDKAEFFENSKQQENLVQLFNPFRFILMLVQPLRSTMFIGHLISMGVTIDKVPYIDQNLAAAAGIIGEGFGDAHYFLPHSHEHHRNPTRQQLLNARFDSDAGHSHDNDIPTRLLKFIFLPVYILASGWDYACSQFNDGSSKNVISFSKSFKKMGFLDSDHDEHGHEHNEKHEHKHKHKPVDNQSSVIGHLTFLRTKIRMHNQTHLNTTLVNGKLADNKVSNLMLLEQHLLDLETQPEASFKDIKKLLTTEVNNPIYATHRFNFFSTGEETKTTELLNNLVKHTKAAAHCA